MISLICVHCSKEYQTKTYMRETSKFCSRSCLCKHLRAGKNKHNNILICKLCGINYQRPNGEVERSKYCSRLCQNRYQANQAKLRLGENNPTYKTGIQIYRRLAKENLPWKCNRCHTTLHLLVHHLDGNRYHNKLNNLEVMCRRCHQIEHKCWERLPKNQKKESKIELRKCELCDKTYRRHAGHLTQRFCSRHCAMKKRMSTSS